MEPNSNVQISREKKVNKQESATYNRFQKFPGQSNNHFHAAGLLEGGPGWSYTFRTHYPWPRVSLQ